MQNAHEESVTVSIIIPAYNSQATIEKCLRSIRDLDYPARRLEVIVVDNGSVDGTPAIAGRWGAKVFVCPGIFVSEMRNYGANKASGDVLGFIDSDCMVTPGWLKSGLRQLQKRNVGIAGCGYASNNPPCWIERHWFYMHLSHNLQVNFVPAGNMLVKKTVFQQIGGFNPRLETGEDSDLCLRLRKKGFHIISDGRIKNIHLGNPRTLRAFLRKEIWYGKGLAACMNARDWRDRTFLLTNLFLAALFLIAGGIALLIAAGNPLMLYAGTGGIGLVVLISTAYRTLRRRAIKSFFHLALLNAVYYFGRAISLMQIYCDLCRKVTGTGK
jgi:glycosyltransferase involved in cell wall biosynthesis